MLLWSLENRNHPIDFFWVYYLSIQLYWCWFRFLFRRRSIRLLIGTTVHYCTCITKCVLSTLHAAAYSFASCSTKQFIYWCLKTLEKLYALKQWEVFKDRQTSWRNEAKVVPRSSYWEFIENEARNTQVLPWMAGSEIQVERLNRNTSLQDVINLIKRIVRFRFNQGLLENNLLSLRIQIWPIRNKQTNVHRQSMQT